MATTQRFFLWFFYGLNGLGGWFLFLLLGLVAVIWLLYDSQSRRLPALGWRMGVVLTALLTLPALAYRFSVDPATQTGPLAALVEPIFYLGLLGGILPPVIAVGYFVTYQGYMGCVNGHIYDQALGECPECARAAIAPQMPVMSASAYVQPSPAPPVPDIAPVPPPKPKAQAWLVSSDGHNYQINLGETAVGRSSNNDIQLSGDTTVGRQHLKIIEQNGHFRLIDLGTKNYTRVNSRIVRQPIMLEPDDEIQLGDNTKLRFLTTRR